MDFDGITGDEALPRALYDALLDDEEARVSDDLIASWLARAGDSGRARLARVAEFDPAAVGESAPVSLHWLYALSRVSDLLLLAPGSHDEYRALFGALGMTEIAATPDVDPSCFDPFCHEIVAVEPADDPDAPIEIVGTEWPGLMVGEMLFARQGVRVRAGSRHAQAGIADRSPIFWTFRRAHRPTVDLSQGWGGNSQWRTDFRRDYRTADGYFLNVDESGDVDDRSRDDEADALVTAAERRELLRNRCFLRAPQAAEALAGFPNWERDVWPFEWSLALGR